MRYELLLQSLVPGTPYDSARVDALLSERGVTARPDGLRTWRLKSGEIEVGVVREGGQVVATELKVPLSERTELVREAVVEGALLATQAEVCLVDPQLGRALGPTDAGEASAAQYQRTARYAGEMMGLSEAVAASFPDPSTSPTFQPTTKLLLMAVGLFTLLYLLMDALGGVLGGE